MLNIMVTEPHIAPSELAKISAPTLVVAGTHDMIKREHTELIAKSIAEKEQSELARKGIIPASFGLSSSEGV